MTKPWDHAAGTLMMREAGGGAVQLRRRALCAGPADQRRPDHGDPSAGPGPGAHAARGGANAAAGGAAEGLRRPNAAPERAAPSAKVLAAEGSRARDDSPVPIRVLASCQRASISSRLASAGLRPPSARRFSMWRKRRSNLSLVARSATSGSTLQWRARLATANRTSPSSSVDLLLVDRAGLQLGPQLAQLLLDLVDDRADRAPVEADPGRPLLDLLGAHQGGEGARHPVQGAGRLRRPAAWRPARPPCGPPRTRSGRRRS